MSAAKIGRVPRVLTADFLSPNTVDKSVGIPCRGLGEARKAVPSGYCRFFVQGDKQLFLKFFQMLLRSVIKLLLTFGQVVDGRSGSETSSDAANS